MYCLKNRYAMKNNEIGKSFLAQCGWWVYGSDLKWGILYAGSYILAGGMVSEEFKWKLWYSNIKWRFLKVLWQSVVVYEPCFLNTTILILENTVNVALHKNTNQTEIHQIKTLKIGLLRCIPIFTIYQTKIHTLSSNHIFSHGHLKPLYLQLYHSCKRIIFS